MEICFYFYNISFATSNKIWFGSVSSYFKATGPLAYPGFDAVVRVLTGCLDRWIRSGLNGMPMPLSGPMVRCIQAAAEMPSCSLWAPKGAIWKLTLTFRRFSVMDRVSIAGSVNWPGNGATYRLGVVIVRRYCIILLFGIDYLALVVLRREHDHQPYPTD